MAWKYEEGTQSYTKNQSYAVSHKRKEEECVVKREILPSEIRKADVMWVLPLGRAV